MFFSRYEHTIDEKGRMTIPSRYREELADGAFVTLGFDRNLIVLPDTAFQKLSTRISDTSLTDSEARSLKRHVYANAEPVELDKAGRILIPLWLREEIGLTANAVVIGAGEYFEIWTPEEWKKEKTENQNPDSISKRYANFNIPL